MDTAFNIQDDVIAHKTFTQGWTNVSFSAFLVVVLLKKVSFQLKARGRRNNPRCSEICLKKKATLKSN